MSRHFKHLKFHSEKNSSRCFFDKKVWFGGLNFQFKAEASKKLPIRNHRRGQRMATDLAIEAAFDLGDVLDVIDVTMREQEQFQIDTARMDPFAGALRRIEQDPAFGRGNEVAVRFENPAAEPFVDHLVLILNEPPASGEQCSGFNRWLSQVATAWKILNVLSV